MRRSGVAASSRLGVCLYLGGLALLLLAWVFGNPPGAAPDEPSHYVRAVGAAAGVVTGHPGSYPAAPEMTATEIVRLANLNDYVRSYPVPAGLSPTAFGCNASRPYVSASCVSRSAAPAAAGDELSVHAGQPPLPYLLAGPGMLYQKTPERADWAGRTALALWCLLLIGLPMAMAGRFRARLLLGLTVALTPMAVFTGSILNPSGVEIFSSLGFMISLIALAEGRHPRGALFAVGFTGLFVTMSRPFAPLWIVAGLIVAASLVGPPALWRGIRRRPRGSLIAALLIAAGSASTLLFLNLYDHPVPTETARFDVTEFKLLSEGAVGDFGWLDTPLPIHVADHWLQVIVALTALALVFGNWWERLGVVLISALGVGATYAISVYFLLPVNVGPQGRHFLPILLLQPLTTILVLARQRLPVRLIAVGIPVVLMLGLQLVGWVVNGTRQGLGEPATTLGDIPHQIHALLGPSYWSPPGGFKAWYVVMWVSCSLLALACGQSLVLSRGLVVSPADIDEAPAVETMRLAEPAAVAPSAVAAPAEPIIDADRLEALFPDWVVSRPHVPVVITTGGRLVATGVASVPSFPLARPAPRSAPADMVAETVVPQTVVTGSPARVGVVRLSVPPGATSLVPLWTIAPEAERWPAQTGIDVSAIDRLRGK